MSRWFASLLLLGLWASTAGADWIAWVPEGIATPGCNRYPVASGAIVVGPDDIDPPARGQRLTSPHEAHLVSIDGLSAELSAFELWRGPRFAVVAPPPAQAHLIERARRKLFLTHIPRLPFAAPTRLAKKVDPQVKSDIVAAVTTSRFEDCIRILSGEDATTVAGQPATIVTRHTHRTEHNVAADWLAEQFAALGYTVEEQNFMVGASATRNIIATKTGTTAPDEIVLVGGHYDSTCAAGCDPAVDPAPGAEDNASGTAALLVMAEILAGYDTERTVVFVAFGGEEQSLRGSIHYTQQLNGTASDYVGALTMDMISYRLVKNEITIEGFDGPPNGADSQPIMDVVEGNASVVPGLGTFRYIPGFGSDHEPLNQAGIPSVLVIQSEWATYPHYHRGTDTVDKLDLTYGANVVRVVAASLADLAVPLDDVPVLVSQLSAHALDRAVRVEWNLAAPGGVAGVWVLRAIGDTPLRRVHPEPLPPATTTWLDPADDLPTQAELRYGLEFELADGEVVREDQETRVRWSPPGLWVGKPQPNPMSQSTQIAYSLPTRAHVRATVYDLAGRRIRTLVDGVHREGFLAFDGTDSAGRKVGAGVYLLRVEVGEDVQTRRLTVLR